MDFDLDELERLEREARHVERFGAQKPLKRYLRTLRNAAPDLFAEIRRLRTALVAVRDAAAGCADRHDLEAKRWRVIDRHEQMLCEERALACMQVLDEAVAAVGRVGSVDAVLGEEVR